MDSLKSKTCCDVVLFRFDGEEIKTDETIRTLAQKWQSSRRPRSEERNTKAVDTDMIVVSCMVGCSKNALKQPVSQSVLQVVVLHDNVLDWPGSLNRVTVKRPQRRSTS